MFKPLSVLFWNIWGHRVAEGVHAHLKATSPDIACLTEVTAMGHFYNAPLRVHTSNDLSEPPMAIDGREQLLARFEADYRFQYHPVQLSPKRCCITGTTYKDVGFGSALLLRHGLTALHQDNIVLPLDHRHVRVLQYVILEFTGHRYVVAHLHGVWIANNTKGDDPLRTKQSRLVLWHLRDLATRFKSTRIILGGDLNLDINTEALTLLEQGWEETPLRNLIRAHGIVNTRTPAYRKYGEPGASCYADYVLVSPDVRVHTFSVNTDTIGSDHAPQQLLFS